MRQLNGKKRWNRPHFMSKPITALIPNMLTTLALCAGLSAVKFALQARFEMAVTAIVIAAMLDGIDGRVARLLKKTSQFGVELDSLADFMSFGVVTAIVVYLWQLSTLGDFGWGIVLIYASCCALRLARFNVGQVEKNSGSWPVKFSVGVAAPAAAMIALLPLVISFIFDIAISPYISATVMLFTAFLMVSRFPTFSFKRINVVNKHVLLALIFISCIFAMTISYPWVILALATISYIATLPLSFISYRKWHMSLKQNNVQITEQK